MRWLFNTNKKDSRLYLLLLKIEPIETMTEIGFFILIINYI